jgi:hypothetical protein
MVLNDMYIVIASKKFSSRQITITTTSFFIPITSDNFKLLYHDYIDNNLISIYLFIYLALPTRAGSPQQHMPITVGQQHMPITAYGHHNSICQLLWHNSICQ